MTAAVYESDIDRFIKDRKSRLAQERRTLSTHPRPPSAGERTGLSIGSKDAELKKHQMQVERNREYNELMKKKQPPNRRRPASPSTPMARQRVQEASKPAPAPAQAKASERPPENYESPRQLEPRVNRRIWREPSSDESTGLKIGEYQWKKEELAAQRRQDMQQTLNKNQPSQRRQWKETDHTGLKFATQNPTAKFNEEKRQEYNEALKKKPQMNRNWREPSANGAVLFVGERERALEQLNREKLAKEKPKTEDVPRRLWKEPSSETGLNVGQYEEKRKALAEERRKEYEQARAEKAYNGGSYELWKQPSTETGLPLGEYETTKRKYQAERQREYNEFLAQKPPQSNRRIWREPSDSSVGLDFRKYDWNEKYRRKQKENQPTYDDQSYINRGSQTWRGTPRVPPLYFGSREEELERLAQTEREYRDLMNQLKANDRQSGLPPKPGTPGGFMNRLGRDMGKRREELSDERRREYNQLLAKKSSYGAGGRADPGSYGASIPGMRGADSAKRIRSQGQDVPPDAPRKGWATPTYEEILEKKRQEEARYRRDDLDYRGPGLRSYGSEGALNGIDGQRRGKDLDKELDKRLRFDEGHRSILDDPLWLSPRRGENFDKAYSTAPYEEPQRRDPDPPHPRNRDPGYYATLPVGEQRDRRSRSDDDGNEERFSAQQRRKEQYRKELQQQMQEAYEAKRREKMEEMRVNASGANDPAKRGQGASSAPPPHLQPQVQPIQVVQAPVYKIADPAPVYTTRVANYDKLSPRSELVLGRKSLYTGNNQWDQIQQLDRINFDLDRQRYTAPSGSTEGILDKGFQSLLEPPRVSSLQPPPGLEYQPSTFVTGGGGMSPMDETYHYLATKNPLDPEIAGASQPRVAVVAQAGAAPGPSVAAGGATRVRFDDGGGRRQPPGGGATYAVEGDDDKARSRAKAQAYQAELARQIEEDKMKKAKAKADQEWYDMKLEREAKDYNPYGKGGGGAPMKDDRGNIMADLRAMKKGYTTGAGYSAFSASPRPPSPRDDKINTPPTQTTALGEVSHARGGHGIFGMPKTEAEKHQSDVYKDDLRRQIEAKKAAAAMERERERYEEEREARRIEAERKKMQDEYEEERKKIKQKEDEARRKNEELMRQAEERKREAEQRRRDAEDERRRQQEEADRERLEREKAERGSSPPVPAVTRKQATEPLERGQSPAEAGPSSHRAPSADILNALARMKHQLASERDRVENMLDRNDNEPEVFDPRLAQRPPPVPRVHHDIDVFERARNRNTVPVRRAPTVQEHPPNPDHLHEFNTLKQADTDSRQEFKRHYPYDPMSNDTLEQQQAALIRQQEAGLRAMRDKSKYEKALPNMEPKDLGLTRHHTISPQPMLQSNSAFIDMNGLGPVFPDDLDDLPRRNDSARQRRRDRLFSSPRPGSVTSLDVDQIARKNEQRLKKLRDMQGDDLSMNDPDDVLDRFVSKQSHNRPPSSQTMQDDSWLQPGSKLSRY